MRVDKTALGDHPIPQGLNFWFFHYKLWNYLKPSFSIFSQKHSLIISQIFEPNLQSYSTKKQVLFCCWMKNLPFELMVEEKSFSFTCLLFRERKDVRSKEKDCAQLQLPWLSPRGINFGTSLALQLHPPISPIEDEGGRARETIAPLSAPWAATGIGEGGAADDDGTDGDPGTHGKRRRVRCNKG